MPNQMRGSPIAGWVIEKMIRSGDPEEEEEEEEEEEDDVSQELSTEKPLNAWFLLETFVFFKMVTVRLCEWWCIKLMSVLG